MNSSRDEWSPRIWEGYDFFAWLRLLVRNRFEIHPSYWYIAIIITAMSFLNTLMRWLQFGLYATKIDRTPIPEEMIFVIGHWRTGTTLLHELLVLDDRFTYPDTYACLEPNHTILTEAFFKTYGNWMMPSRRPMDNMTAGWDRPQEDEFALCLLGLPSSYSDIAFPNRGTVFPGALDLSGLDGSQLRAWKNGLRRFLKMLAFQDPRPQVLKSPPHTARIRILLELFPRARFVHIVRDPYVVFPSTINLWTSLARKHGLQNLRDESEVREKVFREFRVIYERLEQAKHLIPTGRYHELRYEDLVKDASGEMRRVYTTLDLGGYDSYLPKLKDYLERKSGYETNRYQISESDREEVTRRWGDIIEQYGYGNKATCGQVPLLPYAGIETDR